VKEITMDKNPGDPGRRDDPIVLIGPIVRRVIAARATDVEAVDDLVQETLARVIEVRHRIDDRALVPYAIAVGRNLTRSMHRVEERDRRSRVRLLGPQPTTPEEEALRRGEREAITAALARLDQREREALIDHEIRGIDVVTLARRFGSTPGAIAMRLARNRAKLRVEYLIEQSGRPPTELCRPVLVALSSGDRRQQQRVDAAGHLRDCVYCSSLSPALMERRRLTALVPFAIGAQWLRRLVTAARDHPAHTGTAVVTVAGVTLLAVVELGRPTLPCLDDVRPQERIGEQVRICEMRVSSVPADEGFWVSAGESDRIWVLLTGPGESSFRVRAGQRLDFVGRVVGHDEVFVGRVGVNAGEGATELRRDGYHVEVSRKDLRIASPRG
jgi:RNA polymerase sigma factor (sigma-70 family)